jgi:hypothetical protein
VRILEDMNDYDLFDVLAELVQTQKAARAADAGAYNEV